MYENDEDEFTIKSFHSKMEALKNESDIKKVYMKKCVAILLVVCLFHIHLTYMNKYLVHLLITLDVH